VVLIVAGLAGNHFKFTLFFNADFIFGSIFAMLALQVLGLGRGVVAALLINIPLFFLWGHPYGCLIMTAEVAVVGWLRNRRNIGFIQADALYWLLIGMPLVYVFYHLLMKVPQGNALFIMAKDMVNGVANILVARLIFMAFASRLGRSPISYREVVYILLAFFVLCPTLIMLAIESRSQFNETDRQIRTALIQDGRRITDRIETWVVNRQSAIFNLATMAATKSPQQMQPALEQAQKSDLNFIRVGLQNREATVVADYPMTDELGQLVIGKNYSDRAYVAKVRRTLQPLLSEVVMGRVGIPKPLVALVAPVVTQGGYGGYVIGVLSLEQIREHLKRSTDEKAMLYTLADTNGHVIMTNRSDQQVMAPFVRAGGSLQRLDAKVSQWVPTMPPRTPATERWGKSFYVTEASIGYLAEWKLVLEQPVAPFQKALFGAYSKTLALLLLVLTLALAVAEALSHWMTRSFEELGHLTRDLPSRLATEGPPTHWPSSGMLESEQLISNFRQMSHSLADQFLKVNETNASLERRVQERTTQLAQLTEELSFILENAPIGIAKTIDRKQVWMNHKTLDLFLYAREELEGQTTRMLFPSEEAYEAFGREAYTVLSQGLTYETVQELIQNNGQIISIRFIGRALDPANPTKGTLWILEDITARHQAEEALHESERRYRRITEGLTDYQYSVRIEQGRAVATTHGPGCEMVTGYRAEDFAADPYLWINMIVPEDRDQARAQVQRILNGQENASFEHRIIRKDGALRWVSDTSILNKDASGTLLSYDGVVKDITDRKRLEAQLHQSQKMESLGLLAGGVAHDMNNVLAAILGLASVQMEIQPPNSPVQSAFTTITKACIRGGNLIRSLLGFARQGLAEERELDLNALVQDEVRLLERTTLARVRLEMELAADLRPMRGDPSALTHLLMNLCVNAVDAMPENGILTLRTRNLDGGWVEVQVEDTGSGMSKEVLDKALDPFFTTKDQGKGTGLGLSIAYSTVVAHHGQMEILSEPDQGTQVILRFPACEPRLLAPRAASATMLQPADISLKVLLVDDDELIQSSMQAMLEALGHDVTAVLSGEEALTSLEAGYQPDAVILDMNMPGLGGAGTLPLLRALRPTVPVLLTTGRADQTAVSLVEAHPFVTLLAKPFSLKELQRHLEPLGNH
jgi:PAS domain S-box-containing protein